MKLNFIGNIEGHDIAHGSADVIGPTDLPGT